MICTFFLSSSFFLCSLSVTTSAWFLLLSVICTNLLYLCLEISTSSNFPLDLFVFLDSTFASIALWAGTYCRVDGRFIALQPESLPIFPSSMLLVSICWGGSSHRMSNRVLALPSFTILSESSITVFSTPTWRQGWAIVRFWPIVIVIVTFFVDSDR